MAHCFSISTMPLALGTYFLPVSNWPYKSTAVSLTTMPFLFKKLQKYKIKEVISKKKLHKYLGTDFSAYCSVIPWTSFTQSFCSLSDRQVTLVGGGVEALLYILWRPGGSSRQNLTNMKKDFKTTRR